ncbi:amidohydrolase family protein [Microbacterium sp. X-17]|uniref:amidohydrolase family protein n=1 Tax=Microbacterium sp. X-17 TaxID=3144404 RepID=UPI0031F50C1D
MSYNDVFVIDSVIHALDNRRVDGAATPETVKFVQPVVEGDYGYETSIMPEQYRRGEWFHSLPGVETLISAVFNESYTDMGVFHGVPMPGIFKDYSPITIGYEIKKRYPNRTLLYGPISTFFGVQASIDEIDRQHEEYGLSGVKFYPTDFIDGEFKSMSLADKDELYPILQHIEDIGIKSVAVHKAAPLGVTPMDPYRVGDMDYAARDFPNLTFEVVHGGMAFLDESAFQIARYPNMYINMEVTAHYAMSQKRKFAQIMGELLLMGGEDKLLFATGCSFSHGRPVIEAFMDFEMPQDMLDGGYPEVTPEIKRKIMGENMARIHGIDIDERRKLLENDDIETERREKGLRAPWSRITDGTRDRGEVFDEAEELVPHAGWGA